MRQAVHTHASPSQGMADTRSGGVALRPPSYGVAMVDVVQRKGEGDPGQTQDAAQRGIRAPAVPLPYLEQVQRALGRDLRGVVAHTGPVATESAHAMGASVYATGNHVVFAGTPSLHTVAHEVTHVLQQQSGVQLQGGVGRVGDRYERQADAVADVVAQGGSAVGLVENIGSGAHSVASSAIQKVLLQTAGGAWEAVTYKAWGPGRPEPGADKGIGAEMDLKFTPGSGAPRSVKIGLIQTVTALVNGASDPTGFEAVPLNDSGRAIDRDTGGMVPTSSPVYGAHNEEGKVATKLKHQLPDSGENTWGMRYWTGANKAARLWDKPSSAIDHRGSISKTFETAAVVLEGRSKGTYLGSVAWGYHRDAGSKAAPTLVPFSVVSQGNPSADFLEAAGDWNRADKNRGTPLVKVPIPT